MSFFIATVPANTVFYHGTSQAKAVEGTEWLAFEPEHALFFAHPHGGPGGPGGGRPGGPPRGGPGGPPPPGGRPPPPPEARAASLNKDNNRQTVFGSAEPRRETSDTGYLHTYMTKHKLRLLYLDGMSAAKSNMGTLDTQDFVLASEKSSGGDDRRGGGIGGEYGRAQQMCRRAEKEWKGQIDGILRMESGFEIILCSFKDHLETVRITAVEKRKKEEDDDHEHDGPGSDEDMMSFFQAITSRYQGIGGDRVTVDFDDFVSAFTYSQADLFAGGEQKMPRLNSTKKHVIDSIVQAIDRLATREDRSNRALYDWQAIVDMIVARHAPRLAYLTSPSMVSSSALSAELDRSMRPYIDYSKRDTKKEIERCATDFIPSHWPSNTAGQAVMRVMHRICSTLSSLQQQSKKQDLASTMKSIQELKDWLDWTVWKQCTGCLPNEVCLVPMWPHGGVDDWEHPSCVNASSLSEHRGYWGGGGPGGGPLMY